jgi:AcrR family transcriptional regulator
MGIMASAFLKALLCVSSQCNITWCRNLSSMGRPREHDDRTAQALLEAAEALIASEGLSALSVRAVAVLAGTSTRAIYSIFGSKAGLITALGARAFDLLGASVAALPHTPDAAVDLIDAGLNGYRKLVCEHPVLVLLGVQQPSTELAQRKQVQDAARLAWTTLQERIGRLEQQGKLHTMDVATAAIAFHALCEGLGALEIRGLLSNARAEQLWRASLTALVAGL